MLDFNCLAEMLPSFYVFLSLRDLMDESICHEDHAISVLKDPTYRDLDSRNFRLRQDFLDALQFLENIELCMTQKAMNLICILLSTYTLLDLDVQDQTNWWKFLVFADNPRQDLMKEQRSMGVDPLDHGAHHNGLSIIMCDSALAQVRSLMAFSSPWACPKTVKTQSVSIFIYCGWSEIVIMDTSIMDPLQDFYCVEKSITGPLHSMGTILGAPEFIADNGGNIKPFLSSSLLSH